ncbi:MAG: sigma-E processing peptidase SpoIIGA [Syntrophomonadaceae bacterium]|nr:sigma-E processing peptidase SpoIIGA [Syntrophomonadaceae bacterium]
MHAAKVYADLTFLINLSMDFLLLWTTARLCRVSISYRRLFLAAFLGGIYGVGNLLAALTIFYTLPAKVLMSCLLLFIALRPVNWQQFQKSFLVFFSLSFVAAGASMAATFLLPGSEEASWSYFYLLLGAAALILISFHAERYFKQTLLPALLKYQVRLRFEDKICRGEGFLDTGNGLRDPLTRRPIVVAEYAFLQSCLPEELNRAMTDDINEDQRLEAFSRSSWGNRLRLIPFSSLGKKNGMLIGLRCDEVGIKIGRREMLHKNLVVAIYPYKLSAEDDYQLLIPSEVVQ